MRQADIVTSSARRGQAAAALAAAYGRAVLRTARRVTPRELAYFGLRGLAAVGFVLAATVVPHGVPAALLCMACGVLAVLTCIGVNAGGPGERAGAIAQDRAYDRIRAPQGEWPPYDPGRVVEGQVVPTVGRKP